MDRRGGAMAPSTRWAGGATACGLATPPLRLSGGINKPSLGRHGTIHPLGRWRHGVWDRYPPLITSNSLKPSLSEKNLKRLCLKKLATSLFGHPLAAH